MYTEDILKNIRFQKQIEAVIHYIFKECLLSLLVLTAFIGALTLAGVISSMFALYLQLYDAGSVGLKRYSSNSF